MNYFTQSQIAWARSHDWFIGIAPSGRIVCTDEYTKDGVFYRDTVSFTNFAKMRAWAGY
jgi:hypothetical protein